METSLDVAGDPVTWIIAILALAACRIIMWWIPRPSTSSSSVHGRAATAGAESPEWSKSNMKKILTIFLTSTLVFAAPLALSACGQKTDAGDAAVEEAEATDIEKTAETAPFATLGDVFAEDTESVASTFDEQRYVCAFNWGGSWWRIEAALPDGMYDELDEAWIEDEQKVEELLSPLEVTKAEAISPLTVEETEALVGKTGADLAAEGFTFMAGGMVVNGSETDCTSTLGSFDYLVTFDGAVPDENAEDVAAAVADLTVSSVSVQSVSWTALEG